MEATRLLFIFRLEFVINHCDLVFTSSTCFFKIPPGCRFQILPFYQTQNNAVPPFCGLPCCQNPKHSLQGQHCYERICNSICFALAIVRDKTVTKIAIRTQPTNSPRSSDLSVCVGGNRYNKRLAVQFYILTSAGGMQPSRKRMPTKLCVMVEAETAHLGVPAIFNQDSTVAQAVVIHFCDLSDLGQSRRRQAQPSNVPTQITNSHSV